MATTRKIGKPLSLTDFGKERKKRQTDIKVCHSGLFTLQPLRHFWTITHVSTLFIQQTRNDIIY